MQSELTGYVQISYSAANEFGGQDQFLFANAGLNFNLSDTLSLFAVERYFYRTSSDETVPTITRGYDNETEIGIRRNF